MPCEQAFLSSDNLGKCGKQSLLNSTTHTRLVETLRSTAVFNFAQCVLQNYLSTRLSFLTLVNILLDSWDPGWETLPWEIHKHKPCLPKKNVGSWRVASAFAIPFLPWPPGAKHNTAPCILKNPVALATSAELLFQDFPFSFGAPGKPQTP